MEPSKNFEGVVAEVKKLILSVSKLEGLTVDGMKNDVSLFENGLGLDSIDLLELVVVLDKKFGLKIKNDANGQATLANVSSIATAILEGSAG